MSGALLSTRSDASTNSVAAWVHTGTAASDRSNRSKLDFVQQLHQVADLNNFQRTDGILDLPGQTLVGMPGGELVELRLDLLPRERPRREPGVVRYLVAK